MWVQLMARLGYARYAVHGSDWGGNVANRMALQRCRARGGSAHGRLRRRAGAGEPSRRPPPPERNALVNAAHNVGYQEIQSTKPQTLGHALSDSPAGLASWIVEKWYGWADHDGDLEKVFTKDQLLTNVMIYWVTNSGASSARIYQEGRHMGGTLNPTPFPRPDARVTVPTGCGAFPWQYDRRATPPSPNLADSAQGRRGALQRRPLHADGSRRAFPGAGATATVDGRSARVSADRGALADRSRTDQAYMPRILVTVPTREMATM